MFSRECALRIESNDLFECEAGLFGVFVHQHRHHAARRLAVIHNAQITVIVEMPPARIGALDYDVSRAAGVEREGKR